MTPQPRIRDVLCAIVRGRGLIELRAFKGATKEGGIARCFAPATDSDTLGRFVQAHRKMDDVYFGVAPRMDASSGGADNCGDLAAVFVDVDFKERDESAVRAAIADAPMKPSIVVLTGGGAHVYFLLDKPYPALKPLLRRAAHRLLGDLAAAEPARILRVPGTLNHKYTPPRPVTVDVFCPERRYARGDLEDAFPELPNDDRIGEGAAAAPVFVRGARSLDQSEQLARARAYLSAMGPAVEGCGGDQHTFKAAAWLVCDLALDDGEAMTVLSDWNRDCVPPWSEGELLAKVRHARRYGRHAIGAALLADASSRVFTVRVQVP